MPKYLPFASSENRLPEFSLREEQLEELRLTVAPHELTSGWESATLKAVNQYLLFFKFEWNTTSKPIHETYRQAATALRKAAKLLTDGTAAATPEHMRWARQFYDKQKEYTDDPTMARLPHMLAVHAANLDRAKTWLAENEIEDNRPGKKSNEAMSSFIWSMAEVFEEHGLSATDAYTETALSDSDFIDDNEAGAHDTPFIRFMNTIYHMLPEQAQILESESKDGPLAHPIRRVLKEARKLRREANKG